MPVKILTFISTLGLVFGSCPEEILIDLTPEYSNRSRTTQVLIVNETLRFPPNSISKRADGRILGCPCVAQICLSFCCTDAYCPRDIDPSIPLPPTYNAHATNQDFSNLSRYYPVFLDPCHGGDHYALDPEIEESDEYWLLSNGSFWHPRISMIRNYTNYCLSKKPGDVEKSYRVRACFDEVDIGHRKVETYRFGMMISVVFFAATFLVYCLLPELHNLHGLTLRGYTGCLIVAYSSLVFLNVFPDYQISYNVCRLLGKFCLSVFDIPMEGMRIIFFCSMAKMLINFFYVRLGTRDKCF